MKKNYQKLVFLYNIFLLIYLYVTSILYCYGYIDSTFISNYLIIFGIFGLLLYLINKIWNREFRIHDIFVTMMIIFGVISWYFAYDQRVALIGFKSGREGLFVIITYYVIFLLSTTFTELKYKKICLYLLSFLGITQVFYGFLQSFDNRNILNLKIVNIWGYPSGFLSNSNFFGSYITLLLSIWLVKYLFDDKIKLINLIFLLIFMFGLLLTGAMSAYVAFFCIFILTIIMVLYLYKKKNLKIKKILSRYLSVVLIFLGLYFIICNFTKLQIDSDLNELSNQAVQSLTEGIDESFGSSRIHIWKESFTYFKEYNYWVTGIGVDNFIFLGDGTAIRDHVGDIIYKAHNEYLQVLLTEGIFMFLTYIAFLIFIFFKGIYCITKFKKINVFVISVLFSFIGYSIQAFFNISMHRVAPIYFMLMGFVSSNSDTVIENKIID